MRGIEFEDEFHRLLGRLVYATARFDFNVGLQINSFGIYYQRDVKELLDPCKTQLKVRLKELRKIVLKAYKSAGETALAEFEEWFVRADKARALRNDYVHARWGVPGKYLGEPDCALIDALPLLTVLSLTWDMSPNQPDKSTAMTLDEFAQQVETVEGLFADYRQRAKNTNSSPDWELKGWTKAASSPHYRGYDSGHKADLSVCCADTRGEKYRHRTCHKYSTAMG